MSQDSRAYRLFCQAEESNNETLEHLSDCLNELRNENRFPDQQENLKRQINTLMKVQTNLTNTYFQ